MGGECRICCGVAAYIQESLQSHKTMRETVISKGWSIELKSTHADCQRDSQVDNLADAEVE